MTKNNIGYITIVVLLVVTSVLSLKLFAEQRRDHDLVDIRKFPLTIGDWKGRDLPVTEREYEILETRNLISRAYTNPDGENIYLFIIYSETNRSVFHPPEVCLIGSGVTISDKKTDTVDLRKKSIIANKLYTEKNGRKDVALYCYKTGNFYTNSYYVQQALFAFNQLFGKNRGGATIRVTTQMGPDEAASLDKLKVFMKEAISIMENAKLKEEDKNV